MPASSREDNGRLIAHYAGAESTAPSAVQLSSVGVVAGLTRDPPEVGAGSAAAEVVSAPAASRRRRHKIDTVFIVSAARSGSTLLRYLLDSHPQITAPPELNLSSLLQHVVEVWLRTNDSMGIVRGNRAAPAPIPPDVRKRARKVVDDIMAGWAASAGASVYCDKSLVTVEHLDVVSQCYPDASYVFLYRYPLDLIASGLEASKWGFNAYGFAPFTAATPGNFIAGLANYWMDRTARMLAFEGKCTVAHARIYYELLCDDPDGTLRDLLAFLHLPEDQGVVDRALSREHAKGPGDYKIDFTHEVSSDSIGRGSLLPQMIGEAQAAKINELLAELDYPALEDGWNGDLRSLLGLKHPLRNSTPAGSTAASLVAALSDGLTRLRREHREELRPLEVLIKGVDGDVSLVLIEGNGAALIAADPTVAIAPGVRRVVSRGDVLLRVASGEVNVAQAMHDGELIVEKSDTVPVEAPAADRGEPDEDETPRRTLAMLSRLLRPA